MVRIRNTSMKSASGATWQGPSTEVSQAQSPKMPASSTGLSDNGLQRSSPPFVPNTPSPFLHSIMPSWDVPPLYGAGLPPAFDGSELFFGNPELFCLDGMQGFYNMQPVNVMFDPATASYSFCQPAWCVPMEAMAAEAQLPALPALPAGADLEMSTSAHAFNNLMTQEAIEESWSSNTTGEWTEHDGNVGAPRREGRVVPPPRPQEIRGQSGMVAAVEKLFRSQHQPATTSQQSPGLKKLRNKEEIKEVSDSASTSAPEDQVQGTAPPLGPIDFTTVMLRNIPNKYTRDMLVKRLNEDFLGQYDFVYLPIDFNNKCNVGYGFINFTSTNACELFVNMFHNVDVRKCLPGLNSRKIAEVGPARVQGLEENLRRLKVSPVMSELLNHPDWMPLLLDENGKDRPFPIMDAIVPQAKFRRRPGREDHVAARKTGSRRQEPNH